MNAGATASTTGSRLMPLVNPITTPKDEVAARTAFEHDGAALEQPEAVVLEGRNAREGVALQIILGRAALGEDIDLLQPIGHALFLQRQAHDPHVDAVGRAEYRNPWHAPVLPHRYVLCRATLSQPGCRAPPPCRPWRGAH